MAVKIAVTPKYEDEKRQIHSNRLLLYLLLKKLTALSDIFLTFGSYAPDCWNCQQKKYMYWKASTSLTRNSDMVTWCIN